MGKCNLKRILCGIGQHKWCSCVHMVSLAVTILFQRVHQGIFNNPVLFLFAAQNRTARKLLKCCCVNQRVRMRFYSNSLCELILQRIYWGPFYKSARRVHILWLDMVFCLFLFVILCPELNLIIIADPILGAFVLKINIFKSKEYLTATTTPRLVFRYADHECNSDMMIVSLKSVKYFYCKFPTSRPTYTSLFRISFALKRDITTSPFPIYRTLENAILHIYSCLWKHLRQKISSQVSAIFHSTSYLDL